MLKSNIGLLGRLICRTTQHDAYRNKLGVMVHKASKLGYTRSLYSPTNRAYCVSRLSYEDEETTVLYMNGYPTIKVMLPSRDEKCLFTLRPLTDTVGSFLTMVSEEDRGIENISVYKKDGSRIAKATTIDLLLQEDFDLVINSKKFAITPPDIELSGDESKDIIHVKELVSQLYTQMHLSEWHASREQELLQSIDALKHELEPYDKLQAEMLAKSEQRTNMQTWLSLSLMGAQFGFLARLTWWEYSWDIMEPVTYFVTYGTSIALFAYFVLTRQEPFFPEVKNRAFLLHMHKLAKKNSYDVEHYNGLRQKLNQAESDLEKLQQPLGLSLPESELRSLIQAKK
ncbi:calcium uniporter protein, mitochondrial-like [Watersipora subatra]|uniref:calcium uniporter protein, mitochondrial-like n=1 Tax=Watersipora subatra TaxID=2589382 RepID=UPI00355B0CF5